jgi:N6-L-threonylcarbamoyladenine synthase
MLVLGIETSCDECAAAVVEDGKRILSNVVATQIPFHEKWGGVVPEIASRMHTEWISDVIGKALSDAGLKADGVEAVAATNEPGLLGSLLVGRTFAQCFAWTRGIPYIPCNHLLSHLYASRLCKTDEGHACPPNPVPDYPFLGLLVSGGHTIVCRVENFDRIKILGESIDDAVGEAFDKIGKYYGLPYPAGKYIDETAKTGDDSAFAFPLPNLYKSGRRCDMSYSGLKNAVINQRETFRKKGAAGEVCVKDIVASFQKTAVAILVRSVKRAVEETGLTSLVAGGGVAANSLLRQKLAGMEGLSVTFPPLELCGDNAAMVAGLGYQYVVHNTLCASFLN